MTPTTVFSCTVRDSQNTCFSRVTCMCTRHSYAQYWAFSLLNKTNCCLQSGRHISHQATCPARASNSDGFLFLKQNEVVFFTAAAFQDQQLSSANIQVLTPISVKVTKYMAWHMEKLPASRCACCPERVKIFWRKKSRKFHPSKERVKKETKRVISRNPYC